MRREFLPVEPTAQRPHLACKIMAHIAAQVDRFIARQFAQGSKQGIDHFAAPKGKAQINARAVPAKTIGQQRDIAVHPVTACNCNIAHRLPATCQRDLVDDIGDVFIESAQIGVAECAQSEA